MAFVTMTAAGRFYNFCIAMKTGTNVVTARNIQCEFWRRWALIGSMSGKPMRGVSTPGSVNAKSTTQSGRICKGIVD